MRLNLFRYIIIVSCLLHTSFSSANETKQFIDLLKDNYTDTSKIKAFSLTHSYLGRSDPYQSWDYESPTRYKAFKITEIDFVKQNYYQNVVHFYTGGQYVDEVHFQNEGESFRYERNGFLFGKVAVPQNANSFNRYKNLTLMNLDFFAIRPLINEINIEEAIELKRGDANTITLVHRPNENDVMEYVFSISPLQLTSINNKRRNRIYLYSDYRQSNGYYFAHELIKKYNGDTIPSFITRIENFKELKQIDTNKLKLPSGYKKTTPVNTTPLSIKQIEKQTYLVTDDSNIYNTLVKIHQDKITVFGVGRNSASSKRVIDKILQRFPKLTIAAVYVTHPYSDHIAGLLPYVEQGAKIYADEYTVKAIQHFPQFLSEIERFEFETIKNGQVIDGVRYYVLESSRAKRQSFAYFEQSGLIFQTDFLEVPFDNTITKLLPSYSKRFIQFVKKEQIKVNRIVGFHRNNNISPEVMNKYYESTTM